MLSNSVNKKMFLCFHMFFKSRIDFGLLNCLNAKKKNTFGMRNTQYSIELKAHKQPSLFNTTYTLQCRLNCPNIYFQTHNIRNIFLTAGKQNS